MNSIYYTFTSAPGPLEPDLEHPVEGEAETMAVDTPAKSTLYLWYLILVSTIGPLQFGYHLVSMADGEVN
jgi:hypothetical protein